MKRIKMLAAALACLALGVQAQSDMGLSGNERVIGYTVTNDYDDDGALFGTPGTYEVGALMTAKSLSYYKGCKIVGMRLAATADLGRQQLFLKSIANGTMTTVKSQKQRIYSGWNRLDFNGAQVEITGEEDMFFGLEYVETEELGNLAKGALAIVSSVTDSYAFLVNQNGNFMSANVGALAVQLIIDASNLPDNNLALGFVDTGFKYKEAGEDIEVFTSVTNIGKQPVTNYTMSVAIDGGAPVISTITPDEPVQEGGSTQTSTFVKAPNAIGAHSVDIAITAINGEAAPDHAGVNASGKFAVYKSVKPRQKLWMDVFTHQGQAYAGLFNDLLDEFRAMNLSDGTPVQDAVVVAKHHAVNTNLSCPESAGWWNLYSWDCPVFTSNRAPYPGEPYIAYSINDYALQLPFIIPALFQDIVEQDLLTPAFADINISGTFDKATRKLTVTVSGEVLSEAKAIMGQVGLTVILLEDNVKGTQVTVKTDGESATVQTLFGYNHNDVVRAYLSDAYGTEIDASGSTYTKTFEYTVPANWKEDDLKIGAFMSKVANANIRESDLTDYDIVQANSVKVADAFSGIKDIVIDNADGPDTYYDLRGVAVDADNLTPGLYIKRTAGGATTKVIIK